MSLIQVDSLEKRYDNSGILAVKDLSFTIKKGELVSLVGPFGCGKTTVFNLIGGITDDYKGSIKINNKSPSEARKNRKIGYCFQKPNLLPWLNVIENVLLPQKIAGVKEDRNRAIKLLKMVSLDSYSSMKPYNLSGGMQQLVSITRSLILDPDILLLDEPLSSIDEINRFKMQLQLLEVHKKTKKTTLMITHSINEAVFLSDRVVILTTRPSAVKKIVGINFRHRNERTTFSKTFIDYLKIVRKELKNG
jgi:NitT/TauT family transport system ATP-binding protein